MRTDVKLGVAISAVLVLIVGGYFLFRSDGEAPVTVTGNAPIAENKAPATPAKPTNNARNARPDSNRTAANTPARPVNPQQPGSTPNLASRTAQPGSTITQPTVGARPQPTTANPVQDAANTPGSTSPDRPSNPPGGASPTLTQNTPTNSVPTSPALPAPTRTDSPATSPSSGTSLASNSNATNPASRDASTEIHRAQPGDSLISLAQSYYGSAAYVPLLRDANPNITDPSRIPPGSAIKIPAVPPGWQAKTASNLPASTTATTPAGPAPKGPTTAAIPAAGNSGRKYTVKAGDSFYRIAQTQLGNPNRWKELLALNTGLVKGDPSRLRPGQVLMLPGS